MEGTMTHYEVTLPCDNCNDGQTENVSGGYTPDRWVEYRETECLECEGTGEYTLQEVAEFYENTKELLEDYPTALNIKLIT
tara:strand:- start:1654 stop:1896 length:243 start_codon:yes stop_codon:yes gene_type:complete